jgi:mono/diheme cytochrome c family protein
MSDQNFNPDNTDLDRLHGAVKREKADLPPGAEPAPVWVMFLGFVAAVLAGGQMGNFSGYGLESTPNYGAITDPRGSGAEQVQLSPFELAMKKGETAYGTCNGCHQATGLGLPGINPPLAGSDWAQGGTERLIRVVLNGLSGQITVSGKQFNAPAPMPGWGATMSDEDIANALTYVRNSWGNKGSMVTADMVAKVRGTEKARTAAWTEAELSQYATKDVAGDAPPAN